MAFNSAVNSPWSTLINTLYFEYVVGLAFGIQIIVVAVVGVRYNAIDPVVRKRIGRRLVFAFLALFFWLPIASLALQFFDVIGETVSTFANATEGQIAQELLVFAKLSLYSPAVSFLLLLGLLYIYAKVLVVSITRWMAVILTTLAMPLVATFWALEVWPFKSFSGLSKQIAGTYPGAIAASIPTALLIRISIEINDWGIPGLGLFITPMVLLLCAKIQKAMLQKSSPTLVNLSDKMMAAGKKPAKASGAVAGAGVTAGAYLAGGPVAAGAVEAGKGVAKGSSRRVLNGAQMVHRGKSGSSATMAAGASTGRQSGQAQRQGGGSSSSPPKSGGSSSGSTPSGGSGAGSAGGSSSLGQTVAASSSAPTSASTGKSTQTVKKPTSGTTTIPPTSSSSGGASTKPVPNRSDTKVYHHEEESAADGDPPEFDSVGELLRERLKTDEELGPDAYRLDEQDMAMVKDNNDE
ncbi:hypothetical protein [Haloarcula nitratireducens]|uniref:Uncharacterized protein n=1 Tax=Haloarcula nitratireducens TaxID=2487749 RepID=A0AAW4PG85_9EURY|nr:hypothetical protein [Halomicroarcula nitratireducens]MBX0296929.1 hypothetical protein [Halomicroarcula nitratireducens]